MSSPRPHFPRAGIPGLSKGSFSAADRFRVPRTPQSGARVHEQVGIRATKRLSQAHRGFLPVVVGVEIALYSAVAYALVSGPPWSMVALAIAIIGLSGLERRALCAP